MKSRLSILRKETQNKYKLFLGLVRGCNVHILFAQILIQVDTLFPLVQILCSNPLSRGSSFLMHLSPSPVRLWVVIGMLKNLLEVVESVVSYGTTVQVSFPH